MPTVVSNSTKLYSCVGLFCGMNLSHCIRALQHGQKEKALCALRLAHRINHLHKRDSVFLLTGIRVEAGFVDKGGVASGGGGGGGGHRSISQRLDKFWAEVKQV